ncbi:tyrosine-type recombinase/integrase [Streptomyces griseorubiginosus]|uniref:tyrosine-type recombinase/integrase n=1 Tax=Streptomyces griseorubiginosus TaxID=67304 RepID=UPI0036E6F430
MGHLADLSTDGDGSEISKTVSFYAVHMLKRMRQQKRRKNTIELHERCLRLYLLPFAGQRVVSSLRRTDSLAVMDYLLAHPRLRSPYTVNQAFRTWVAVMHHAADQGVTLPSNLVTRIGRAETPPRSRKLLTPSEVRALAEAMHRQRPRYAIAIWLGACAGLRKGEIFGLKWEHIDIERGLLTVQEQLQSGRVTPLKSRASYATLAVDHFLLRQLAAHLREFPSALRNGQRSGYVLTRDGHHPVTRGMFDGQWRRAVEDSALARGTCPTDLRVFYASTLANANRHSPKKVQRLARHAHMSHTWDLYVLPPLADDMGRVDDFTAAFADTVNDLQN